MYYNVCNMYLIIFCKVCSDTLVVAKVWSTLGGNLWLLLFHRRHTIMMMIVWSTVNDDDSIVAENDDQTHNSTVNLYLYLYENLMLQQPQPGFVSSNWTFLLPANWKWISRRVFEPQNNQKLGQNWSRLNSKESKNGSKPVAIKFQNGSKPGTK